MEEAVGPTILLIWIAAAGAAALGYAAASWRRQAGLAYLATLLGLLGWHALSLSHPMALLLLLTPGAALALGSLAGGFLLAMLATVAGLWHAASADGSLRARHSATTPTGQQPRVQIRSRRSL
jgi:hypothetical protein